MNTPCLCFRSECQVLLVMFSHCSLSTRRDTAAVCFVHTCRFECSGRKRKKRSFSKHFAPPPPTTAHSHDVKTPPPPHKKQKASHFHNVTVENAQAAVMSTRPGPTRALSIGYSLSEQKCFLFFLKKLLRVLMA